MAEPRDSVRIEEDVIDLRAVFRILSKWKTVIILGTMLTVLSAALISYFLLEPVYEARVLLQVTQASDPKQTSSSGAGLEGVVGTLSRPPQMTMQTYVGQLTSQALKTRVAERLNLKAQGLHPASLGNMVSASVIKDSNLIEVKVQHTDRATAVAVANAVGDEYILFISEMNQEQMARSVAFLQDQHAITEKELQAAVAKLKESNVSEGAVQSLRRDYDRKSTDLAAYRSQLGKAGIEVQQLQAGLSRMNAEMEAVPRIISSERFSPDGTVVVVEESNPVYVALAQKVSERRAVLAEKEAEVFVLNTLIATLEVETEVLQASLTEKQAQMDRLQGEVKRLESTVNMLAQKITETQIARSIDLGQASVLVVSPASEPRSPIKPNKKLNMAVAFVLGMMVFVALSFLLEHLDYTIKTPEDVDEHLELPVLGMIPVSNGKTGRGTSYG